MKSVCCIFSDDVDDEDDDDDDVAAPPLEGMYDPSEYENLNVQVSQLEHAFWSLEMYIITKNDHIWPNIIFNISKSMTNL